MNTYTEIIKSKGLKVTPARLAVIESLNSSSKPLDVSDILKFLEKKKIAADQATIYRIIESFYSLGLINRLQFQEKKFYYESVREEHHHAICTNCGVIEDISGCSIDDLEKNIERTKGFTVNKHSLEFFGICRDCKAKKQ